MANVTIVKSEKTINVMVNKATQRAISVSVSNAPTVIIVKAERLFTSYQSFDLNLSLLYQISKL